MTSRNDKALSKKQENDGIIVCKEGKNEGQKGMCLSINKEIERDKYNRFYVSLSCVFPVLFSFTVLFLCPVDQACCSISFPGDVSLFP